MLSSTFTNIFKSGSKTYFYSSLFFPKEIKDDVSILYAFVRTADNYVDAIPQQKDAFYSFVETYQRTIRGTTTDNEIIGAFVDLMNRKNFDPKWVEAFLDAMGNDLTKNTYHTLAETEKYMYGSAEVIGLMMAAIMGLPSESYPAAQKLGKAMQYINFIRDIQEDISLGRTYLPLNELRHAKLKSLQLSDTSQNPEAFKSFVRKQIAQYKIWQDEAEKGFHYIPKRYRIPIKTASDMYNYTAKQIYKDPFVVYKRKVKPGVYQIFGAGLRNSLVNV
jgi:15-cis-phytoene synthase